MTLTHDAICMLLYTLVCVPDGQFMQRCFFCNLVSWFHIVFDISWRSLEYLKLRLEWLFLWHRLVLLLGLSMAVFFCALCASPRQLSLCYWCFNVAFVMPSLSDSANLQVSGLSDEHVFRRTVLDRGRHGLLCRQTSWFITMFYV